MIFPSDDPKADFDRWDAEQTKALEALPVCDYCDEPIQDDYFYEINGDVVCQECLDRNFRKEADL